ncbi:metal-sensitive transcriptional regulator [bacterium]|nr:metal-sensitive transcriptional regulator [bacterium]
MGGLKANSKNHTDHKTHREKSTKERSIHRFKIAKGHIDSIITQIENDEYCLDIVH